MVLEGGAGVDMLVASLDAANAYPDYAPTVTGVEQIDLTVAASDLAGAGGLMFSNISGAEEVWNVASVDTLALVDLQEQVAVGAQGTTGTPYAVRYNPDTQLDGNHQVYLEGANLALLTITQWVADVNGGYTDGLANITALDIGLAGGENTISSFTENGSASFNLSNTVTEIRLTAEIASDGTTPESGLALGEVWGGLMIDMSELKGQGNTGTDLDLTSATGIGDVTVTVADFDSAANNKSDIAPGNGEKSDQKIALPSLSEITGTLTIENLTVADDIDGSSYAVNDVLSFAENKATAIQTVSGITVSSGQGDYASLDINLIGGNVELTNVIAEEKLFSALNALADAQSMNLSSIDTDGDNVISTVGEATSLFASVEKLSDNVTEYGEAAITGLVTQMETEGFFVFTDTAA